jgi:hypothetical protein
MPFLRSMFLTSVLMAFISPVASGQVIVAHRGASHDAPENTSLPFSLHGNRMRTALKGIFMSQRTSKSCAFTMQIRSEPLAKS